MPRPTTTELAALLLRAHDLANTTDVGLGERMALRDALRAARTALLAEPPYTAQQVELAQAATRVWMESYAVDGYAKPLAEMAAQLVRAVMTNLHPLEG